MKQNKSFICRAVTVIITFAFLLNMTAFAAVTSFSKGYGFEPNISAMKKADASLNGQIFDGTEMKTGDYILPEGGIPNYKDYSNGLSNIFVWEEYTNGGEKSYRKVYGAIGTYSGWYNYAEKGNCAMNQSTPFVTAYTNKAINQDKGGPYIICPKNGYVSFGRYDIDFNGYNEVTVLLSSVDELPLTKLQLAQDRVGDSDVCEKVQNLITLEASGDVKLFGSDESAGTIINNGFYNTPDSYYVIKYILDARTSSLKHSIEITKYSDSSVIASAPMQPLTDVNFDISNLMGLRLMTEDADANGSAARLALDEFKLVKAAAPLGLVTTQSAISSKKVPMGGGDAVFSFDAAIDSSKLWEGSVYALDKDGQGVPLTFRVSGKKIIVTFGELEPGGKYTVYFNDILPLEGGSFSGSLDVYSTSKAELSMLSRPQVSGGVAQITMQVKNNHTKEQNYILLLTVFKDGVMLPGVYYKPFKVAGLQRATVPLNDVSVPAEGVTYKAYLIDSFKNMCAVSESFNF